MYTCTQKTRILVFPMILLMHLEVVFPAKPLLIELLFLREASLLPFLSGFTRIVSQDSNHWKCQNGIKWISTFFQVADKKNRCILNEREDVVTTQILIQALDIFIKQSPILPQITQLLHHTSLTRVAAENLC